MLLDDDLLKRVLLPIPEVFPPLASAHAAAVLAPLFRRDGQDWLLFTLRRTTMIRHAGQVAFPGGRRDQDESPSACAIRETGEEIGLHPPSITVLGSMPPRRSTTGFFVTPVVARVQITEPLVLHPMEVERVLEAPLAHLSDPGRWKLHVPLSDPTRPPGPHFVLDGAPLFGLTARFVLDLVARIAN